MREYDLCQEIATQISKLSPEQMEDVRQYIQELGQTELQDEERRNKYLTFVCCEQTFGVNIQQVIQILQIQEITALPDSLPYMKGVISLRGEMVPIIDMRVRLGRDTAGGTEQTCIVIMNVQGRSFGAIVDRVCNVETILPEEICTPPKRNGQNTKYLRGIAKRDRVILLLDADYLFGEGDLAHILDISAQQAQAV